MLIKTVFYLLFVLDDCEEVELRCRQLVTALEMLLGESLQKYF